MPTTYSEFERDTRRRESDASGDYTAADEEILAAQRFDPRAMQDYFTSNTTGAEGLYRQARAVFGINLDDRSEMDIYKVLIGPPSVDTTGFFITTMPWDFAYRAEQTSYATSLDESIEELRDYYGQWYDLEGESLIEVDAMATRATVGRMGDEIWGKAYGDSPHMTDTYESYLEFIENPDGYNVAQFAVIMQYANLYNWQNTISGEDWGGTGVDGWVEGVDDNVAMSNNTLFIVQPYSADDSATITNTATTMPELGAEGDSTDPFGGLDMAGMDYRGQFTSIPTSTDATSLQQQLRTKWKCSEVVHAEMEAFLSEQATAVANTITMSIDTKLTAKRQRSVELEPSVSTALHAGSKTRPTSTYTPTGEDMIGVLHTALES